MRGAAAGPGGAPPAIVAYTDRFNARPLVARCKAQDAEIAAVQDADRVMQPS